MEYLFPNNFIENNSLLFKTREIELRSILFIYLLLLHGQNDSLNRHEYVLYFKFFQFVDRVLLRVESSLL